MSRKIFSFFLKRVLLHELKPINSCYGIIRMQLREKITNINNKNMTYAFRKIINSLKYNK
jgi:hypothetical protein